jgi:molecular chaperone DnaK
MLKSATAIGIDLGTTFSVVAYLEANGQPRTLSNSDGDSTTHSVVLIDEDGPVIGKEAVKASSLEPHSVAQFMKRDIGKPEFWKSINGTTFPPEVLQALLLRKLRQDTIDRLGQCDDVVITVPAYFNEPRRKATQDAGRMAGLNVLDIINEPTAAAIAYGVGQGFIAQDGTTDADENIMVYDLGGGTFDVSIMRIEGNAYTVLATDGNVQLGGIDFDQCLSTRIAEEFAKEHGVDPRNDLGAKQRLHREAEEAKRALSAREKLTVTFELGGQGVRVRVTRDEFESMTDHLLERTRFTVKNLMRTARLSWGDLTRVLLVGGSTRMPMVARMLEHESGRKVDRSLAADEAVAHGAAIYAGLLGKHGTMVQKNLTVSNVCSHSLGVLGVEKATGRKKNRVMIPANTPLPAGSASAFETYEDGQSSVAVNIIEGGDASGNNSTSIGRCVVRDLPPRLPAATPVNVKFKYAANGRLQVSAEVPNVKRQVTLDIERSSGMTEEQISAWTERIQRGELLAEVSGAPMLAAETDVQKPQSAALSDQSPDTLPAKESKSPPSMPGAAPSGGPPPMPGSRPSTAPPPMPGNQNSSAAIPMSRPAQPAKRKAIETDSSNIVSDGDTGRVSSSDPTNAPVVRPAESEVSQATLVMGLKGRLAGLWSNTQSAAQLVKKQAERTQLANVTLPATFRELGRHIYTNGQFREEYSEQYDSIGDLERKLQQLPTFAAPAEEAQRAGGKVKGLAGSVTAAADRKVLEHKRRKAFAILGKAAYEQHGEHAGEAELVSKISECRSQIESLKAEIAELSEMGKGQLITPKRITITAAVVLVLFVLVAFRWAFPGPYTAASLWEMTKEQADELEGAWITVEGEVTRAQYFPDGAPLMLLQKNKSMILMQNNSGEGEVFFEFDGPESNGIRIDSLGRGDSVIVRGKVYVGSEHSVGLRLCELLSGGGSETKTASTSSAAGTKPQITSSQKVSRDELRRTLRQAGCRFGNSIPHPDFGMKEFVVTHLVISYDKWVSMFGEPKNVETRFDDFLKVTFETWTHQCTDGPVIFIGDTHLKGNKRRVAVRKISF